MGSDTMSGNYFDLNLLRALDALLAEKNVTRAAERVFITQPAMSGALHRLRDYFKDQLLVRMGREMEVTPLGEALAGPVRELLLQAQLTLETRLRFDPKLVRRKFRMAMSDYAALTLMPGISRRLEEEAPYISCQLNNLDEHSFELVESGDLDFCISADDWKLYDNYSPGTSIRTVKLFADDFVCITDADNPSVGETLTLEEYISCSHLAFSFSDRLYNIVDRSWKVAELDLNVRLTVRDCSSMFYLLRGTSMIATVQRRLVDVIATKGPIKVFECPLGLPKLQEILGWHARNEFDPGHRYFRQILTDEAERLN